MTDKAMEAVKKAMEAVKAVHRDAHEVLDIYSGYAPVG